MALYSIQIAIQKVSLSNQMFQTDIYFKNKDLNMHCRNKTYNNLNSSFHLSNSAVYKPASPSPHKLLQPSSSFYQSGSMTHFKIKESFCSPQLQKKKYVRHTTEGNQSSSHRESPFIEASNKYNAKQVWLGSQQAERSPFKAICSNFQVGSAKRIKNQQRTAAEEVAQIKKNNLQSQQPLFNKIIKKMNDKQKLLNQIRKIAEIQLPTRNKRPYKQTQNTRNLYSFRNKDINHAYLSSRNVEKDKFKENSVLEKYTSSTFSSTLQLTKNPQEKEVRKKHAAYRTDKSKKSYDLQNSLRSTCSTTTFYQKYSTPQNNTKSAFVDKQQCFMKKKNIVSYDLTSSQVKFQNRDGKQSKIMSMQQLITKKQVNGSPKLSDFIIVKNLGEGKFGTVSKVIDKNSGFIFAMKKISKAVIKSHLMIQQLALQIRIQSFCNHKNIARIYTVFDDSEYLYLLLEFMEEGTLFNYLKKHEKLSETQTAIKMKQVAEAVKYLHDQGIAHRDIKPENIVLTNGTSKLCDFGWATICNQRRRTYCGTFDYAAPQILQGSQYDMSVDMWCLGVLAYELLVGKAPFYHISRKQTMKKIMNVSSTNIDFPSNLSKNAKDFIKKLLIKQPEQRLTAQAVLKHPFLTQVKPQ